MIETSVAAPRVVLAVLGVLALASSARAASAEEPVASAARAELQLAYELKQQGRCAAALPHLQESLRLDRQIKTLMHLADCEEQLGQLLRAEQDWTEAFERANSPALARFHADAAIRLEALERRVPRLTIVLAAPDARDVRVSRDGVALDDTAFGRPIPADPGDHRVSVEAAGHEPATYAIALREGETRELVVAPGPALATPKTVGSKGQARSRTLPLAKPRARQRPAQSSEPNGVQPKLGWAMLGLGSGVIAASGVAWLVVWTKYGDTPAACATCDARLDEPRREAVRSAIGMAAGAVLAGTGLALLLTAPKQRANTRIPSIALTRTAASSSILSVHGQW